MKMIFMSFVLVLGFNVQAKDLICNQINQVGVSEMKISYGETQTPEALFLRSPKETNYRPLPVQIEVVGSVDSNGHESFTTKPIVPEINWDNEKECYKEVGTLMYFLFWHNDSHFYVELYPYFVTEYPKCVPPRFQPQKQILSCKWLQVDL